jgi:hypothetical protein
VLDHDGVEGLVHVGHVRKVVVEPIRHKHHVAKHVYVDEYVCMTKPQKN